MQPEPEFEITVLENPGGLMSKRIYLSDDGRVISDGSACVMPSGIAKRIKVTLAGFGALISSQPSQQAIALGVLRGDLPDRVQIVTKHRLQQMNGAIGPDIIARTADFIVYRPDEPGLMLGDYDQKGMPPEVKQRVDEAGGFLSALKSVLPALEGIGRVVRPSTSAGLYREDTGVGFAGSGGLHDYIAIADASDAERALRVLHDRCVLGVATRFVQNCTLSRPRHERGGNIAQ